MEPSELFSALDRPGPQDKVERERERERPLPFEAEQPAGLTPSSPRRGARWPDLISLEPGAGRPLMTPVNERKRGINFVFDSFNLHHSCCHPPPPNAAHPPPFVSSSPHPFIYCFKSVLSFLPAGMTLKRIYSG